MEVSYKRSSALVFAGFLYRSSLNIESFREFWKATLANLILNFSLLLSLMPINNVLLCCSRASFSVSSRNHEVVQIFYTICSAKLSFIIHDCSDASLLSAQRCFAFRLLPILFKSQYWNSSSFARPHLQMWCWIFSLWFSMMSSINIVLLCFGAPFSVEVSVMKMFKASVEYVCSAKVSFKSLTIVLIEDSYRHSNALVFAGLLYCSSLNVETLW